VSPVKYELGFYIPEDDILHSHCRENLRSYLISLVFNDSKMTGSVYTSVIIFVGMTELTLRMKK
jgi:hypothetical protein